ncbi:MAG TPA: sulfoxide reductase heme-binding subunit YedZ [Thioalkalivibrio sp.]|nr:sulfoxide reductase heme-binding subunit YedZ [Thioalkalivibrio sp.]
MVGDAFTGGLGVNPVEAVTHRTGDWTLRLLLATLALTPLRRLSGWSWPSRVRRMVGLFVFFYACLHLATYLWLDQFFDWGAIVVDVGERPFITVGMLAFLGLLPLAVTSNRAMQRRLGRRWKALHRLVYPVAILGVLHFWWLVKADVREPLVYALILATLLGYRLAGRLRGARERARERLST